MLCIYEISMAVVYWFCIVRQSEEVLYAECPGRYCPQQSTSGLESSAPIENVASVMLPMHSKSDSSPRRGKNTENCSQCVQFFGRKRDSGQVPEHCRKQ